LVKAHSTAFHGAFEWLLTGVNSEMIKEIVPFSEEFTATVVIAGEDL